MKKSTHLRQGHANFDHAEQQLLAELPWYRFRKRRWVRQNAARARQELESYERAEQARLASKTPKASRGVVGQQRRKR